MATGTIPKSKTLLWTNPSPTATFVAQTIAIDLTGYDAILIEFMPFPEDTVYYFTAWSKCLVGRGSALFWMFLNTATAATGAAFPNAASRTYTVSTTGVTFAAGQMLYGGNAYKDMNSRSVPTKIYGIRE